MSLTNVSFDFLAIEDDRSHQIILKHTLEVSGLNFTIDFADTLTLGFAKLFAKSPDLVFLDLQLPDATPEETLAHVDILTATTRVIVLTGYPIESTRVTEPYRDRLQFLEKNFGHKDFPTQLRESISEAISRPFTLRAMVQVLERSLNNLKESVNEFSK